MQTLRTLINFIAVVSLLFIFGFGYVIWSNNGDGSGLAIIGLLLLYNAAILFVANAGNFQQNKIIMWVAFSLVCLPIILAVSMLVVLSGMGC